MIKSHYFFVILNKNIVNKGNGQFKTSLSLTPKGISHLLSKTYLYIGLERETLTPFNNRFFTDLKFNNQKPLSKALLSPSCFFIYERNLHS